MAGLAGGIAAALVLGTAVSTYFALAANQNTARATENAHRVDEEAQRRQPGGSNSPRRGRRTPTEAQRRDQKLLSDHRLYLAEMSLAPRRGKRARSTWCCNTWNRMA